MTERKRPGPPAQRAAAAPSTVRSVAPTRLFLPGKPEEQKVVNFWNHVGAGDTRKLSRLITPDSPLAALVRLYGPAGPLNGINVPAGHTPMKFTCGNYDQPVAGQCGGTTGELHTHHGEYRYLLLWSPDKLLEENPPLLGALAGAEAIHLHPRDLHGVESLQVDDVATAVSAVRDACPDVPVGVSTGLWISDGDVERRLVTVARWATLPGSARPDFASVNVSEPGFAELVEALHAAGVGVEGGVWSTADARALAAVTTTGWTRVLVEIIGGSAEAAVDAADAVLACLDELGVVGPRLLHGEEAACWPLVAHAGRLGLPTRIGLEDITVGPAGEPVADNADLVRRALSTWTAAGASRR